jgi:hypothetical protein
MTLAQENGSAFRMKKQISGEDTLEESVNAITAMAA